MKKDHKPKKAAAPEIPELLTFPIGEYMHADIRLARQQGYAKGTAWTIAIVSDVTHDQASRVIFGANFDSVKITLGRMIPIIATMEKSSGSGAALRQAEQLLQQLSQDGKFPDRRI